MSSRTSLLVAVPLALSLAGCGDSATLPEEAAVGPNPSLPPPASTLIPTLKIAPAKGWPAGAKPAQILYTATAADVTTTVVGGEIVVSEGRHRLGDVAAQLTEAIGAVTTGGGE